MVRVTNAVAAHRRKKRLLKKAKGFVGDRKNHLRLTACAVMASMAFHYDHRKLKKREYRRLWTVRLSVAAKINGLSYSKLIHGLKKTSCLLNRKMLSDMAIRDPKAFAFVAESAKKALFA